MSNPGNMNFLPEDYVEKRQATKTAIVFIGLLLVVIGGIVGVWLYTLYKNKPIFDENTRVNAQYEESAKKIAEFQAMDKERAKMVAKAEVSTALMERVRRFALLEELTRIRPKGVNFLEINLKSENAAGGSKPLSEFEKAQRAQTGLSADAQVQRYNVIVEVIGTAPTDEQVALYIAALNRNHLFTDVNLEFSQEQKRSFEEPVREDPNKTKDDTGTARDKKKEAVQKETVTRTEIVRKFHVTMKINPLADLRGSDTVAATDAEGSITTK